MLGNGSTSTRVLHGNLVLGIVFSANDVAVGQSSVSCENLDPGSTCIGAKM